MKRDREFEANPYYSPEKCGLTLIDTLHGEEDYSFSIVCVWKDNSSGKFYWASDSGCSCPTPFEDYTRLSDLSALRENFHNFKEACENRDNVNRDDLKRFISRFRGW